MDCKYIEQLLERYWQCETSLEEEAQLRAFFNGSDVPEHLLRYKDLFVYQQLQQEVGLFKAAAVVAVVLSLGNVMQHSFYSDIKEVAAVDTIGKQITAPSVALSGDVTITHEQQILDSLQRVDKKVELKK